MIITCTDPRELDSAQTKIKNASTEWRQIAESSNGTIIADSGRFELGQIPVIDRTNFTEGLLTAPVTNEQDSSKTFAYILKLHDENEPKSTLSFSIAMLATFDLSSITSILCSLFKI